MCDKIGTLLINETTLLLLLFFFNYYIYPAILDFYYFDFNYFLIFAYFIRVKKRVKLYKCNRLCPSY